jgi:hypothetical protein
VMGGAAIAHATTALETLFDTEATLQDSVNLQRSEWSVWEGSGIIER